MRLPENIKQIISMIETAGYKAYAVGGALRDIIRKKEPNDWDIATSSEPEITKKIFDNAGFRTIPTGIKHGTITVISDDQPIEITTFRREKSYTDSRHPDKVEFTESIVDDLSRRDFTINAIAFSEKEGFIDPFGGIKDITLGVIKCVGNPEERFSEDALRIMRCFRFSAQLGYSIESETLNAAKLCKDKLGKISFERIGSEFLKLITSQNPKDALLSLSDCQIFDFLFPDITIDKARFELLEKLPSTPQARLGGLLWGVEPACILRVLKRLKYSNSIISKTQAIADGANADMAENSESARRFLRRFGSDAKEVIEVSAVISPATCADFAQFVLKAIEKNDCISIKDLAVGGDELLTLGFSVGKEIGGVLQYLLEEVIKSPNKNQKDTLLELAKKFKTHIK